MNEKVCTKCCERKPLFAFHRRKKNKDGKSCICAACSNAARVKVRNKTSVYQARWRAKYPDKSRDQTRRDMTRFRARRAASEISCVAVLLTQVIKEAEV